MALTKKKKFRTLSILIGIVLVVSLGVTIDFALKTSRTFHILPERLPINREYLRNTFQAHKSEFQQIKNMGLEDQKNGYKHGIVFKGDPEYILSEITQARNAAYSDLLKKIDLPNDFSLYKTSLKIDVSSGGLLPRPSSGVLYVYFTEEPNDARSYVVKNINEFNPPQDSSFWLYEPLEDGWYIEYYFVVDGS